MCITSFQQLHLGLQPPPHLPQRSSDRPTLNSQFVQHISTPSTDLHHIFLSNPITMSYAAVAASGPKQSPEEA